MTTAFTLTTASGHTIEVIPPSSPAALGRALARLARLKGTHPCPGKQKQNPTLVADAAHRPSTPPSSATPASERVPTASPSRSAPGSWQAASAPPTTAG